MDTGKKLKQLRLAKGYTLEELGNIVGVGKSTVRKWETGAIANMRRDKIAKLAQALDTTVEEIIGCCMSSEAFDPVENRYKVYFHLPLYGESEKHAFDLYVKENQLGPYEVLSMEDVRLLFAWRAADDKTRRKVAIDLEDYGFKYFPKE